MSELINTHDNRATIRWKLLTGASALALTAYVSSTALAGAEDSGQPQLWIELGGQLDRVSGQPEPFEPPFTIVGEQHGLLPVASLQTPARYSIGENGSISFQPEGSQWSFIASVAYGRSSKNAHRHQEVPVSTYVKSFGTLHINAQGRWGYVNQTADYIVRSSEKHTIVDFAVGKDFGLGSQSNDLSNQFAFGVRFAQFTANTAMNLHGDPNPHRDGPKYISAFHATIPFNVYYQFYKGKPQIDRSFHGVGPSLSYRGSVPIAGSGGENAEIDIDWGANAALLFGRQKTKIHHHTTGNLYTLRPFDALYGLPKYTQQHYHNSANTTRSRSVTVPNIGGVAGLSLKFPNAKISIGYRADFFFGAIDGGIDTAKKEDRGFFGPYASISIGLGD